MILAWTPSTWELLIILVVFVLLWGRRLPRLGRWVGVQVSKARAREPLEEGDVLRFFLFAATLATACAVGGWLLGRVARRIG